MTDPSNPLAGLSGPPLVEVLNAHRGGFNETLGLRFTAASEALVVGEIELGSQHTQPYGLVHGGVYASMVETLASTGAALSGAPRGHGAVGLENSTSFLRASRGGRLIGRAVPLSRGRRAQVWEVEVRDADERLLAKGKVRLLMLAPESEVAGEKVGMTDG